MELKGGGGGLRGAQATPLTDERNPSISALQLMCANCLIGYVVSDAKMPNTIEKKSRIFGPKIENLQFLDHANKVIRKCDRIVYCLNHRNTHRGARAARARARARRP